MQSFAGMREAAGGCGRMKDTKLIPVHDWSVCELAHKKGRSQRLRLYNLLRRTITGFGPFAMPGATGYSSVREQSGDRFSQRVCLGHALLLALLVSCGRSVGVNLGNLGRSLEAVLLAREGGCHPGLVAVD